MKDMPGTRNIGTNNYHILFDVDRAGCYNARYEKEGDSCDL